jgi:glutamate racemase
MRTKHPALRSLRQPIGVFDAGIGSYAIVDLLHRRYPQQDLIYFADRASFPYGGKSRNELLQTMRKTVDLLQGMGAVQIVVASNAPSVMVLDQLKQECDLPLYGVYPPVADALRLSRTRSAVVMGVQSLIDSREVRDFIAQRQQPGERIALVNASPLVQLVESGEFLTEPETTLGAVRAFMDAVQSQYPDADVFTLSSTHLPWLTSFFERACPTLRFLDPAESMVAALDVPAALPGAEGRIACVVSESADYPLTAFRQMLALLKLEIAPVRLQDVFPQTFEGTTV